MALNQGDVPHFKIYTVTNVRTQHIRQRVEFGKAAHTDTAALAPQAVRIAAPASAAAKGIFFIVF